MEDALDLQRQIECVQAIFKLRLEEVDRQDMLNAELKCDLRLSQAQQVPKSCATACMASA